MEWEKPEEDYFLTNEGKKIAFTKRTARIDMDYYVEASKFKRNIVITLFQVLYDYGDGDYPEYADSIVETWKVPISEIRSKWKSIKQKIMKHVNNYA
jgi:hypothetical protein